MPKGAPGLASLEVTGGARRSAHDPLSCHSEHEMSRPEIPPREIPAELMPHVDAGLFETQTRDVDSMLLELKKRTVAADL